MPKFLPQQEYTDLIHKESMILIGFFKKTDDGDQDGIPNVILENMLVGNLIFSTIS